MQVKFGVNLSALLKNLYFWKNVWGSDFLNFNAHSNELFLNLNLLKIWEIIEVSNVRLVHQILNDECPPRVLSCFLFSYSQHDHETRSNTIGLLSRPSFRTLTYGVISICY